MFDAVTQSQIWQALLHEAKERSWNGDCEPFGISFEADLHAAD